jgi:flagellar basal body rod protein FlgB
VGRTVGVLKEATTNLIKAAKEMGLTINMQKTMYTDVTKLRTNTRMLRVDDQEFERVRDLKYLGYVTTDDNNTSIEIKQRILMANQNSYDLKKQLSSRYLGRLHACFIKHFKDPYSPTAVKLGPSQRKMKICSKTLKEEY